MNNKDEIKVDSFITYNTPYDAVDRVTHGSEYYYMGHCIVEYNNELYLADTLEEQIYTDEGSAHYMSGMGKHDYVGDITEEIDIPWLDEGTTKINCQYIDELKKIGKNGQLSKDVDIELERKIKEYISFSMLTSAENYCQHNEYDEDNYSINPNLEEVLKGKVDIELDYDSVTVSKNNMPYGKINATLESKDDKIILNIDGKEYYIEELLKNVQPVTKITNKVEVSSKKQELIDVLSDQQKKIEEQEKELAELKVQRRSLDE